MNLAQGVALGVDWSGARMAGRKVWAARLAYRDDAAVVERLWRPFAGRGSPEIAGAFGSWLESELFDVAGLDFCFGLEAGHMAELDLPRTGPAAVGGELAERFGDNPDSFKAAVGPERRRVTDRSSRSPFCPTNLRMYRQTFWGLRALAGLPRPVPPWTSGAGAVIEILPADVARRLGVGAKTTREGRQAALEALGGAEIELSEGSREAILADRDGDALDAVYAAIGAARARGEGFGGAPPEAAATGEGWTYSYA